MEIKVSSNDVKLIQISADLCVLLFTDVVAVDVTDNRYSFVVH
jgi:hypothetical protein